MITHKKKYSSELHIGLLVIIIILILLNFLTNYILYEARTNEQQKNYSELNRIASTVGRNISVDQTTAVNPTYFEQIRNAYFLNSLILISGSPSDDNEQEKIKWLTTVLSQIPPGHLPEVAHKVLTSNYNSLHQGIDNEYVLVVPLNLSGEDKLLILSKSYNQLAFFDDASTTVFYLSLISIVFLGLVYFRLYRFILSPFAKLRSNALQAGRDLPPDDNDVEAVISEYQNIISELKDKETQLKKINILIQQKADSLEEYNQYLLQSMVSGIINLNNNGSIVSINSAAIQILNLDESNLVGRQFSDLNFLGEELIASINDAINNCRNQAYREFDLMLEKTSITVAVTVSVITDNQTEQIGVSLLLNDLSELKQLRKDLERSNQLAAMGEMSAGLAHQLRNSIAAISGYSNLASKKLKKENLSPAMISPINDEIIEAEQLISKFLNFTKPYDYNSAPVNINMIITDLLKKYEVQPEYNQSLFKFETSLPDSSLLCADELLIKQALTNLIDNSLNAYPDKNGTVHIKIAQLPEELSITIEDHGCGISESDQDRIFTPFYSSSPSGTGLGLPLAKRIIMLHQGRISLISTPGSGTTFTIFLPYQNQSQPTQKKAAILQ